MVQPRRTPAATGLRERKKLANRKNIERAALDLFVRQGYERTTLGQIAEAADVAPRTIFTHFPSKEAILFGDGSTDLERLGQALAKRPASCSTADAVRAFIDANDEMSERDRIRGRIIAASPELGVVERARAISIERMVITAVARDLQTSQDDMRAVLAGTSICAAFVTIRNGKMRTDGRPLSHEQTRELLESALTFLAGGIRALTEEKPSSAGADPVEAHPSRHP